MRQPAAHGPCRSFLNTSKNAAIDARNDTRVEAAQLLPKAGAWVADKLAAAGQLARQTAASLGGRVVPRVVSAKDIIFDRQEAALCSGHGVPGGLVDAGACG
jgi:hypothetical protein